MPATVELDVLLTNDQAIAAAKETDTAVEQIGTRAGSASQVASRAMGGYEKAMQGASAATAKTASDVGQLLVKQQQLAGESARLTQGINLLERVMQRAPEQANIFSGRLQELLLRKRAVGEEAATLRNQLSSLGEGTNKVSAATGAVTDKADKAAGGLGRLTSQVRTSGTIFEGFDGILTAGLASIGGVTLGTSILISVVGALIPKLFGASEAKKEEVELNKQIIEQDIALQSVMLALISTSSGLNLVSARMVETQKQIVSGDLTASLSDYGKAFNELSEAEKKTKTTIQELEAVQKLYKFAVEDNNKALTAYNETGESTRTTTSALQNDFSGFKVEINRLNAEVSTGVKSQQQHRAEVDKVIGSLVIYARATGESTAAMREHAAEANLDTAAIDRLALALDGATQAQIRFQAQRASFKAPDFDFAGTSIGQADAQKNFADALQGASRQLDQWYKTAGLANDEGRKQRDLYIAMTPLAKAQNDELAKSIERESSLNGHLLNKKQVLTEVRSELGRMTMSADEATRSEGRMRLQVLESNEALKESGKQHNGAAAAARSYANALVDLRARLADLEAELTLDTFAFQEFRIHTQIQKEREHLEINKRDKEAALQLLDRIERAMIEKAHLEALRANDSFLKQQFDQHKRHLEQVERQEAQHQQKLLNMFIDRKRAEEGDQNARARLALSAQEVANEAKRAEIAARAAIEVEKVAKAYGHASNEERIFGLQLRALEQLTRGDFFGGLITSIQAWNAELIQSGGYAQIWSDAIVGAFDAAFNQGANFLEAFGKLLIAGLLKAYGQAAIASGTYHIAEGIARMATIWDFAGGAREFAAGTALVALGGAMVAGASALTSSIGKNQQSSAGGAAANAGGGASSTPAARPERQSVVVDFATSGHASNQSGIPSIGAKNTSTVVVIEKSVYLDAKESRNWLSQQFDGHMEKRKVVSLETARGRHNRELRDALDTYRK